MEISIVLENGNIIDLECESIKISCDDDGKIKHLRIVGVEDDPNELLYVDVNKIVAITKGDIAYSPSVSE